MSNITAEKLEELGMLKAAKDLRFAQDLDRKLAIAFEHFRYVSPEQFQRFNSELREKTERHEGEQGRGTYYFDRLVFTKLEKYAAIPPADVLLQLEQAQALQIFDYNRRGFLPTILRRNKNLKTDEAVARRRA